MPRKPRDKFFSAINESYDALLSAIEAANSRGYRVSRTVLREARKGEREVVNLARKWSDSPTSFFDLFESVVDVQTKAQTRSLELARDFLKGASAYRGEAQEALSRVVRANRTAGEATADALRDAYSRLMERVRSEDEIEPESEKPAVKRPAPRRKRPSKPKVAARAAAVKRSPASVRQATPAAVEEVRPVPTSDQTESAA